MRLVGLLLLFTVCAGNLAAQAHQHSSPPPKVGKVVFPISCSQATQTRVEHGIALLHSFLFDDSEAQFEAAATLEPSCAMAYWAEAIGLYRPLVYLPSDVDMKQGWDLVQKAQSLQPKTQRERDYVAAAALLYHPDYRKFTERNHQYSAALEKLSSENPHDSEAAVFYALSLLTYADSQHPVEDAEKAIAILKPIFKENPDHPGIAHYLIHASDSPQLAQNGLDAARHYAQIAPDSPHALHMPSHIFARLGLWKEDIQSNLTSLEAARSPAGVHVGAENQLHAMEFLEYAYLQIAEDQKAEEMLQAQTAIRVDQVDKNLHDYVNHTRANSPSLYFLETRNWKAVAALQPDPNSEPYNQAIIWWAKAVAAGHLRDLAEARRSVEQYDAMVQATKEGPRPFVAKFMTTKGDEARAWLFHLQGQDKEAIELLQPIADKQDIEGKGEIELPAREMLADLFIEMNRPAEALAQYEKSLKTDPNRFNGLFGAGKAAEMLGEREKERKYFEQLLTNCIATSSARPELAHARAELHSSPNSDK